MGFEPAASSLPRTRYTPKPPRHTESVGQPCNIQNLLRGSNPFFNGRRRMEKGIYKVDLFQRLGSVEKSNISTKNKQLIHDFVDYCVVTGLGEHRILKYISTLKIISTEIQVDLDKVTEKKLKDYIVYLEHSDASEWTKHDYKVTIRKFYKWLLDDDNPASLKWLHAGIPKNETKLPEDIFTEKEIHFLISTATNKRDKALIALLWDIGARIGEIGNLCIKDIKFDEMGVIFNVSGKTGPRRVRGVFSVDYIKAWLDEHPFKDNPASPLWIKVSGKQGKVEKLRYEAIRMQLIKISRKAGINKKIHPHLFRHSRATYMANYLTEAQMNQYFGWVQGSGMPAVYVHLSGRDVDDAILKANGFTKPESSPTIAPRESTVCQVDNIETLVEDKLRAMMMKLLA